MTDAGDGEREMPLDPATERLRRRMVRLLAISVSAMLIGVMAVLGAIVYKLNSSTRTLATVRSDIALPAGSEILDMALAGDAVLLRLRRGAGESLLHVDLVSGRVLADIRLNRLPPSPGDERTGTTSGTPPLLDLYRSR